MIPLYFVIVSCTHTDFRSWSMYLFHSALADEQGDRRSFFGLKCMIL